MVSEHLQPQWDLMHLQNPTLAKQEVSGLHNYYHGNITHTHLLPILASCMQVNLWGLDAIKTKGESVAIALYLLGAEPVREGTGRIARFALKPLDSLQGRPRIGAPSMRFVHGGFTFLRTWGCSLRLSRNQTSDISRSVPSGHSNCLMSC